MSLGSRASGGLTRVVITAGGTGYTAPPTVTFSGGASGYCQLAGTAVGAVIVTNAGTTGAGSVSFTGGGGTGASARGVAYTGPIIPMTFFKGRYRDVYGVDGMGRGFRWDGAASTGSPLGLAAPPVGPSLTASSTAAGGIVQGVQLLSGGNGYSSAPAVVFTGGTPTTAAQARATVESGRVVGIRLTDPGAGYQTNPIVSFTGGLGQSAALTVGVVGRIESIDIIAPGSGYTQVPGVLPPTAVFSTAQGLSSAYATFSVGVDGGLDGVSLLSAGTGATTTGVTATVAALTGSGAIIKVNMRYGVSALTVGNSGSGYYSAPLITFEPGRTDTSSIPAGATATINATGNISGATVFAGGDYAIPPRAYIADTHAIGQADVSTRLVGKYRCCMRYIDSTPPAAGGPLASSISPLVEVDTGSGAGSILWTLTHPSPDARATSVELWRTTADQSVILFRVATLPLATTTYSDTISDTRLRDPERGDYALMPIVLPSGQINARRFEIPPGDCSVACMFQDRAWYAGDTSGERPNSLFFSEVDEPESVPTANELIVQENTGNPDRIIALIPLGGYLLVAQQQHLYKLSYVAQPVIDASILLAGYRGVLNNRCWDLMGGVAFIVDGNGMYAFDGSSEESLSVAVDNYWRDGIIDFSKSAKFHVRADFASRTVKFYYCQSADSEPTRALCYCVATKAWWEESYPEAITASCAVVVDGKRVPLLGSVSGGFVKHAGTSDGNTAITYRMQTGNFALVNENGDRGIGVLYSPTASTQSLALGVHYNNSASPRANAISTDRGSGFVTTQGATQATLDMSATRSALGAANGYAKANLAGRLDDKSAGADRHISIAVSGAQSSGNTVAIHGLTIHGAG